jgi:predicted acylesterase/phospholipase RssA
MKHAQAFRTYQSRGAGLNPTIVEAVYATMAIPSHFVPVRIGSRRDHKDFVGGPLGSNNPIRELLKEASVVFGNERRVAQVVSIGCGVLPVLSLRAITNETGAGRLLKEIPDECEMVAKELAARLYDVDAYLRLSVEKGLGNIEMDQWGLLGDIEMHTACYIETQTIAQVMEISLKRIQRRPGAVTLGHLSEWLMMGLWYSD